MEYRHTQVGWVVITAVLAAVVFCLFSYAGDGWSHPVELVVSFMLAFVLGLFCALTVTVEGGDLICRFGPGIIRKRIRLSEIEEVQNVRNPWYAGWGIRWRVGQYVLWNVSGLDAVELTFRNGDRFRIGTDEPEALVQAIQSHKNIHHQ